MKCSVVIPNHNEGDNLKNTIEAINESEDSVPEIIVVDYNSENLDEEFLNKMNVKTIKSERGGICQQRNLGAKIAKGKVVVFLDAHVCPAENSLEKISDFVLKNKKTIATPVLSSLEKPRARACGMTLDKKFKVKWLKKTKTAHVPISPGCGICVKKSDFLDMGMFDDDFTRWGSEDIEFSIRAWLFGYNIMSYPESEIGHLFRDKFPYEVNRVKVNLNLMRTLIMHFKEERIRRIMQRSPRNLSKARKSLQNSDVHDKKRKYMQKRKYSDDWFVNKFNLGF